jgi:hypothetical protein
MIHGIGNQVLTFDIYSFRLKDIFCNSSTKSYPSHLKEVLGKGRFRQVLQRCVAIGPEDFRAMAERARRYALRIQSDEEVVEQNRRLFTLASKNLQKDD